MLNPHEVLEAKFNHRSVRLVAVKSIPKLHVAGEDIGPIEENTLFEAKQWVSEELVKSGDARLADNREQLTIVDIQKAQIKETIQSSRRLSSLPENFYPKLRHFLSDLKSRSTSEPGKADEFQKASQLATDIVTSRLNKILLISSVQEKDENTLRNMTVEEMSLYDSLHRLVNEWRIIALRF
jgi:hypothetical protein